VVFADNYGPSVSFQGFGDGAINDVNPDPAVKHSGATSLRVLVPDTFFAGGAFTSAVARNLSGWDALTFWAKASKDATLDVAGIGVDNTPVTPFKADRTGIPLTTTWTKIVIPIPLPAKLTAEKGLFYFAEGSNEGAYTIWLDDIRFEKLGAATLGAPEPAIAPATIDPQVGTSVRVQTSVTFPLGGSPVAMAAAPRYFTFASSDETVATVDADGVIDALALGTTEISATLGTVPATSTIAVTVVPVPPPEPAVAAPDPLHAATAVISLFSDAYTNVPVDRWSTDWDDAVLFDVTVAGDATKKYTDPGGVDWGLFVGIEFLGPNAVDATAMTHFHFDAWTPDATELKVKLVDAGPNGVIGTGGDDTEQELTLAGVTTGTWMSYDIPLTDFTALTADPAHLSQLIYVATNGATLFLDNVYFYLEE
jgi:hypothetical protein